MTKKRASLPKSSAVDEVKNLFSVPQAPKEAIKNPEIAANPFLASTNV